MAMIATGRFPGVARHPLETHTQVNGFPSAGTSLVARANASAACTATAASTPSPKAS
jgi:hypothetical protein